MHSHLLRTANPHIARLPKNQGGRDFVVGDMHGCLDAFNKLLTKANFDPKKDRVICTGDLTHRGPDSMSCLRLLKESWFFSVRGNHEENTIDALNLHFGMPTTKADAFYQLAVDGGLWLCELVAKSLTKSPLAPLVSQALADALYNLQNLPKIIIVGEAESKYIVAHAGLIKNDKVPPQDPKFNTKTLFSELEIEEIALGQAQIPNPKLLNESKILGAHIKKIDMEATQAGLDSNELNRLFNPNPLTPLSPLSPLSPLASLPATSFSCPVFCGHTPLSKPLAYLNHVHLDTGAGKPDKENIKRRLTMINISSKEIFQTRASFAEIHIEPRDYAKKVEKAIEKGKEIPSPN